MLEALKFVQKGVGRRAIIPGLSHFRIVNRRVTGFNGAYALSAPVDIGFNCAPAAKKFVTALDSCEDVITLKMDSPESLQVRSGDFRTSVPCIPLDDVPETLPEGEMIKPLSSILHALESLKPFVGVDASRPWATGVLFAGESAYATNNIIVAQYWLGTHFPRVMNVPSHVIAEVISVCHELTAIQVATNSVTFHYADGRWIKSACLNLEWPDVNALLNKAWDGAVLTVPNPALIPALEKLKKNCEDGHVYFQGNRVATHRDGPVTGHAVVDMEGAPETGCYHIEYVQTLLDIAEGVDWTKYPAPVPFVGGQLRGAMVGIKG